MVIWPSLHCKDKSAFSPIEYKFKNLRTKLCTSCMAAMVESYFLLLKPLAIISAQHMLQLLGSRLNSSLNTFDLFVKFDPKVE